MKNLNGIIRSILALSVLFGSSAFALQDELPSSHFVPPDARVIDKFGVNLVSGQVDGSLNTVAIGGALGLSHSISMETNGFSYVGLYGYFDKFTGRGVYRNIKDDNDPRYAMIMSGPLGTEKFKVMVNGKYVSYSTLASGYTYESFGDTRNFLEESDDRKYLIWTMPDGTELYYYRVGTNADSKSNLRRIVFPNGLTYYITSSTGVKTNTGYELKYLYELDTRGLSPEKIAIKAGLPSNAQISGVQSEAWSKRNPKSIVAYNNVFETCYTEGIYDQCDFDMEWPEVRFTWPGGMPQVMYLGDNVFSVEHPSGAVTEYHFQAQDVCLADLDDPNSCVDSLVWSKGQRWSPRVIGIKSAHSRVIDRNYKFENDQQPGQWVYWALASETGKLVQAWGPDGSYSYLIGQTYQGGDIQNTGTNNSVLIEDESRAHYQVWNADRGVYNYEPDYRNFLMQHVPMVGTKTTYEYDERGNLEYIKTPNSNPPTVLQASYPDSCNDVAERKRCNKPNWTKDAEGRVTNYEYHRESGQVSRVTYPADRNGIRPETRYSYEQKYAMYKDASGAITQAGEALWVLTRKSTCRKSAASGNACSGNDEVITTYEYGADDEARNLHIKGVVVTDAETGESRRTCYSYDRLGNQVGEIRPKANLSSCQ